MGMWTSAGLGYGYQIDYDERHRLPWRATDDNGETIYDGDADEWWLAVNGWDDAKERPTSSYYEDEKRTKLRPEWDSYFERKREFKETLPPLPFRLESSGYCDYAATMILALDTVEAKETDAVYTRTADRRQLVEAVQKYGIDVGEQAPKWHLFGYYG